MFAALGGMGHEVKSRKTSEILSFKRLARKGRVVQRGNFLQMKRRIVASSFLGEAALLNYSKANENREVACRTVFFRIASGMPRSRTLSRVPLLPNLHKRARASVPR